MWNQNLWDQCSTLITINFSKITSFFHSFHDIFIAFHWHNLKTSDKSISWEIFQHYMMSDSTVIFPISYNTLSKYMTNLKWPCSFTGPWISRLGHFFRLDSFHVKVCLWVILPFLLTSQQTHMRPDSQGEWGLGVGLEFVWSFQDQGLKFWWLGVGSFEPTSSLPALMHVTQ